MVASQLSNYSYHNGHCSCELYLHLHAQRPPGVAIPGKRTFGGQVESLGSDARKVSVPVTGSPSCKACSYTVGGIGLGRPGQLSDLSHMYMYVFFFQSSELHFSHLSYTALLWTSVNTTLTCTVPSVGVVH